MKASALAPPVSPPVPPATRSVMQRLVKAWPVGAAAMAALIGLLVLAGWSIGSTTLIAILPNFAAAQPMTALCLLLGGAGVWGVARGDWRWALFGVPLALIAMVTLAEYATGRDLGIDHVLFARVVDGQHSQTPGRMAESSAMLFILLAITLALLARGGSAARPAYWLATAGATASAIVMAGYAIGSVAFRSIGLGVQMALPTALGMSALFGALASLATAPRRAQPVFSIAAVQRAILALLPLRRLPVWLRVAGGAALPVAALGLRDVLGGFPNASPMAQFVPAVVVAAFLLGPGAGAVAAITSTLLGRTLFAPLGSLIVASPRAEGLLLLFLIIFLIVATAIDTLFAVLERVDSDAEALRRQAWLIDQSHDAILAWEADGSIVHWSRGAQALYGHSASEAMGRNVHELLGTRHPEPVERIAARLAAEGEWSGDVLHRTADGRRVTVNSRLAQVKGANGRTLVLETNRDLTAKRAAERRAANEELRLAAIVDALPVGVLVCEAPSGRIVLANRALEAILRHTLQPTGEVPAFDSWEAYHADGRPLQPDDYPMAQVLATGAAAELELQYRRGDGSLAWLRAVGAPIRDVDGALVGGVVCIVDVDAERRLLEHQRLLMAELSHRVKNMLAVVQGIASSTLRRATSLTDFSLAFEGRLQALSTAHTQLLRTDWRGAHLRALIEAVLAPHAAGDRLQTSGSDLSLNARQGVALALVLHELATNAARHGALAVPDGRIAIAWHVHHPAGDGPRLQLEWLETGLPGRPVIGSTGLGARLITRTLQGDLDGHVDVQPGDNDLRWIMDFSLASGESAREGG